jgi:biopolymer transport protein TolR
MKTGTSKDQFMSEINIVPLVDVVLVLLIIFMVASPMMVQGIDVQLPKASANALPSNENQLIISIDNDMKVYINDHEVGINLLPQKLEAILENADDKNVYLKADKQVPYGMVVNVMSQIKKAGVNNLGMITIPEDPENTEKQNKS